MGKYNNLKQIGFSDQMIETITRRIDTLGLSFPDYIRYLVVIDTDSSKNNSYSTSKSEEIGIKNSMKNLKDGDYKIHDDIKSYLEERIKELD